jgi:hypothetical protein
MIKNTNTLLLYIVMILLLYCFMYMYIYNDNKLVFDNNMDKFLDLTEEDQVTYINNLQNIKNDLNYGIVNGEYINDIKSSVNSFTLKKKNNDTLNKISGIYLKDYIENINKKNAIVYNEYLRQYSKSNIKS